ncbi:glycosyltransferase [Dyadobacter sp. CY356]|uniref:glycosyltransferase family 2 protein n=1 Tax=Dyadobacter sp. CY356 TaxID=2906442 RepID=UPI001F2A1BBF|nr:glycosyltransferase [Dyadobacter sp. CY356]MCF0056171.1 glycosyltransferase [Dyadobacter sp. CY356]
MTEQYITPWLVPILWILISSYGIFTILLYVLWKFIPAINKKQSSTSNFLSVIIPVRNEQDNIENLLNDLEKQSFPYERFEVLVVDDSSTDQTAAIVKKLSLHSSCNISLISLPNIPTTSPKKRAIETAIIQAKGNIIVTTDGDCRVRSGWLQAISDCQMSSKAKLISGPVTFFKESSFTDYLQTVEFSSLIGSGASAIAAGFPSLCNGANLAYEKSAFFAVDGYDGVRHIASGDDEFLMHKIAAKYPGSIKFLKNPEAVVSTKAHTEWSLFFRQRKRWASKWKHYQSKTPLLLALYIFLCNLSVIVAGLLWLSENLTGRDFGILLLIKCAPEWLFLGTVLHFLKKSVSIFFIPFTQIFYPFYVCFFGLIAQKPEYEWKGRKLT